MSRGKLCRAYCVTTEENSRGRFLSSLCFGVSYRVTSLYLGSQLAPLLLTRRLQPMESSHDSGLKARRQAEIDRRRL
jgi:hypothetical protein